MRFLCDSCFWFGLVDGGDEYFEESNKIYDFLMDFAPVFLIPYPTLYEVLNTKFMRYMAEKSPNRIRAENFINSLIVNPQCYHLVSDSDYTGVALRKTLENNYRGLSFVDNVLREMAADHKRLNIDSIITFNYKDFCDLQVGIFNYHF